MRDRYIQDTRIHCCLYFINPTGHSLRPIDVIVMKKLSEVVNVVPVIAKSDSLTLEERARFKAKIREEFAYHNIRLYPFDTDEDDEEEVQLNESIRVGEFVFEEESFIDSLSGHDTLCCGRFREQCDHRRQVCSCSQEPLGSRQR